MKIYIKRAYDHPFFPPERASAQAAGFDLVSTIQASIPGRGGQTLIPTGFEWELPEGHVGLIRPRSGLSVKQSLDVGAGVIDADFRGEVQVLLRNFSGTPVKIEPGQRIAQMLVIPVVMGQTAEVAELTDTVRGDGGYGSTGV